MIYEIDSKEMQLSCASVTLVTKASITRWGWQHQVIPGSFTEDPAANRASLASLEQIAKGLPGVTVHLGHQPALVEE